MKVEMGHGFVCSTNFVYDQKSSLDTSTHEQSDANIVRNTPSLCSCILSSTSACDVCWWSPLEKNYTTSSSWTHASHIFSSETIHVRNLRTETGTDAALWSIPLKPQLHPPNKGKNKTCFCGTFSRACSLSLLTAKSWFQTKSMSSFLFHAQNTVTSISIPSWALLFPTWAISVASSKKCSGGPPSINIQIFLGH